MLMRKILQLAYYHISEVLSKKIGVIKAIRLFKELIFVIYLIDILARLLYNIITTVKERIMSKASLILKLSVKQDERTVSPVETGGRISYFFRTFTDKISDSFKANLMYAAIFALPVLFLIFLLPNLLQSLVMDGKNFIANIGIGYPGTIDDLTAALQEKFVYYRTFVFPLSIPAIILAFVGLSGVFHIARGFMWGEKVKVHKAFFRGIKYLWRPFLITGVIVAAIATGIMYGMQWHFEAVALGAGTALGWILFSVLLLVGAFTLAVLVFLLPTFACYRFTYLESLKNALLLMLTLLPTTLFIMAFSAGIVLLALAGNVFSLIIGLLMLTVGFMFIGCMWTGYGQYAFDAFIVPQYASIAKGAVINKNKKNAQQVKNAKKVNPYKEAAKAAALKAAADKNKNASKNTKK